MSGLYSSYPSYSVHRMQGRAKDDALEVQTVRQGKLDYLIYGVLLCGWLYLSGHHLAKPLQPLTGEANLDSRDPVTL